MSSESTSVPRLLTVRQLAELTGLQQWRVYSLVRSGDGPPYVRIGRTIRFPENAVQQWIREQTNHKESAG